MDDGEFQNWNELFVELQVPDDVTLLIETDTPSSCADVDSAPSLIGEIESMLMKDDDYDCQFAATDGISIDDFLSDILLDFPGEKSGSSSDFEVIDKESNESVKSTESGSEKEKEIEIDKVCYNTEANNEADDPISKKQRGQLRNRDAAVRSRERKKMYVKDLEIKSKYLEGECRRLGRMLQCMVAENQALRYNLQCSNAYGVPVTKQESAVLMLESLLLGSLLWFLGIMCLFNPLTLPRSGIPLENVDFPSRAAREAGSKVFISSPLQSVLLKSRRCKGSRARMKTRQRLFEVLA
jgi:hypothetical protein